MRLLDAEVGMRVYYEGAEYVIQQVHRLNGTIGLITPERRAADDRHPLDKSVDPLGVVPIPHGVAPAKETLR